MPREVISKNSLKRFLGFAKPARARAKMALKSAAPAPNRAKPAPKLGGKTGT